jgi:hypothetical protein
MRSARPTEEVFDGVLEPDELSRRCHAPSRICIEKSGGDRRRTLSYDLGVLRVYWRQA